MSLDAISAPYNFVPLADWVHTPDWSDKISHDLPFRDGLSGHLDLTITAHTPILVGREQQPANDNAPGEVHPYQLPDGRYALPGTALKGMIRSVLEIASFSRMSAVDDVRYGLRDITGKYVSAAYTEKVRNKVRTGFMEVDSGGLPVITPCAMVRLSHRELERWLSIEKPIFPPSRSVAKKYQQWTTICNSHGIERNTLRFFPSDGEATKLGEPEGVEGVPVWTGQINDSSKSKGKSRDFIFFAEDKAQRFPVSPGDWRDFLFVHGDQAEKDAESMSWPGYWKQHYWDGEKIPVFFLRVGEKTRIGLAYMPRLAGDFSVAEMLAHANPEHLTGKGREAKDMAECLFGTVGDLPEDCSKGRVTFHHAVAQGNLRSRAYPPTILNGPKASYFPNYLKQRADSKRWRLVGKGYATCIATQEHPKPELRGWKRYPARAGAEIQSLTAEQEGNKKMQVILYPLEEDTKFTTRMSFHNLRPEEFGALCWALSWGGAEGLRHTIGMGKPFGFGQISISITGVDLSPNHQDSVEPIWRECRDSFIVHMEQAAKRHGKIWRESPQIRTLFGMADPAKVGLFRGELRYMRLDPKKRINEFVKAKQDGLVLADYPHGLHPPTWAEQQAAAEAARKRAEFEALPESRQLIVKAEQEFDRFMSLGESGQRGNRESLIGVLNRLYKTAKSWTSAKERCDAGNLLERVYDAINWFDPGKNRRQREKQEDKRRKMVADLRQGCDD